jgi:type II secretion system protein F
MPRFRYEAKRSAGEKVEGVLDAEDRKAAVARLRDMGYFPTVVEPHSGALTGSDGKPKFDLEALKRSLQRIKLKERNVFFRQLANLVESGMLLTKALRTLVSQTENPRLAEVIDQLRDDVQKGNSLADAMEKHPRVFPVLYTNLVRAGEAGGMLDEVLWRIVTFGEQEEELRGKAVAAMIYPAFLTIVGFSAIFILVSFVFPNFVKIFDDFNAELPLPTVIVMAVCEFMGNWWWAVILVGGLIGSGIVRYFRTPAGRLKMDNFLLRVPAVKVLVQKYEMAKFARTLGTLLDNGVPVLTSLRITADTMGNAVIREEVSRIHSGVTGGESMSECLAHCPHFPPLVVSMFAIGEESGRIGGIAKRVADAYDIEVDRAVKAFTSLFEPLLIVIMGVIIGFLVIAMLLPMLNLSSVV